MKSKLFNNYQLYTVLHPEDNSPAFAPVTQSAIRVLKPLKKCTKATKQELDDGLIPDLLQPTDVVAQLYLETLIEQGLDAGLPCLQHLQSIVAPGPASKQKSKVVAPTKVPKYTKKQFYKDLAKALPTNKFWRRGQHVFNLMLHKQGDKVNTLRGGPLDPYYHDRNIEAFVEACLGTKKGAKK
jgi:hypothetical protein